MFYAKGTRLYRPLYEFVTTGCLALYHQAVGDDPQPTEYGRAVLYGRPLFAKYQMGGMLPEKESEILRRMLLWQQKNNPNAWNDMSSLVVLATRVQVDVRSTRTVSQLVSKGYASLTKFEGIRDVRCSDHGPGHGEYVASITYGPDPVLAYLAMCMMDEKHTIGGIQGQKKEWWVNKSKDLFVNGLCYPPQGDAGDLLAALYLLFRGDEIRKNLPNKYHTFSVSLKQWIQGLMDKEPMRSPTASSGTDDQQNLPKSIASGRAATKISKLFSCNKRHASDKQKFIKSSSVNFIQVCRNDMQYPFLPTMDKDNGRDKCDGQAMFPQQFLAYLYQSACAFYTYPHCPHIDLYGSIWIQFTDGSEAYRPLLVSVKVQKQFTENQANKACETMKQMFTSNQMGGLCLLVIFGGTDGCEKAGDTATWGDKLADLHNNPLTVVVRLHGNGFYGLVTTLDGLASDSRDKREILESAAFLRGHDVGDFNDSEVMSAKRPDLNMLKAARDDVDKWQKGEHNDASPDVSGKRKTGSAAEEKEAML